MESLFSLQNLMTLLRTHLLLTSAIIATLVAIALIAYLWEQVCYFSMRVWHGLPVIGTVARLSGTPGYMKDGWPSVESDVCGDYKTYYDKYDLDSSMYRKSKDYLAKVGEAGRRPIPAWVLALAVVLLIVEAVGFGFVLGPFVNTSASANQMAMLAWSVAFLLALISGGFAHFAGHDLHYNSLVKKAHAWWSRDGKNPQRPSSLKQLQSLDLDDSFSDNDAPDYQKIMARIHANHDVTQKKKVIYGFFGVILILAIAAFWIRAYTLELMETDMVSQVSSGTSPAPAAASPFDLPEESAAINSQADNQSIQDKMDATRHASLVTYIVLSVVYIAIQCLMLWLSTVFGFVGVHSRAAWENTHRFSSADQFERWHANLRTRIAGHADHKLRLLQQKRSSKHTTIAEEQDSLATEQVGSRNFLSYVLRRRQDTDRHDGEMATARQATVTSPAPAALKVEAPAAPASSAASAVTPDARTFHDLTAMNDTQLQTLSRALKMAHSTVFEIREQQLALQSIGSFGAASVPADVDAQPAEPVEVDAVSFKDLTPFDDTQLAIAAKAMKMPFETLLDVRAQQAVLKQLGMFGTQEPA